MLNLNKTTTGTKTWQDHVNHIKAARKELEQYYSIMTEYERLGAQVEIRHIKDQHLKTITEGILGGHEAAIQKLKTAHEKVNTERQKEIASWDGQKLAAEMQTYSMLIDQAVNTPSGVFDGTGKAAKILEDTYSEAFRSGDKYKARAIAEVLKSAPAKYKPSDKDTKDMINHLAKKAEQDMTAVRSTPELQQACADAENSYQEYLTSRNDLIKTVKEIGEPDPAGVFAGGPFAKAVKRVQVKDDILHIYEPNDPEVTGTFIK